MDPTPTKEQQAVIDEPTNCVVIAKPGSGKTSTLAWKIKFILEKLPDYKGVVAISFTNKASSELERRCLSKGIERKSSFFGTIDKFFISEIVIPFGSHVYGVLPKETKVVQLSEIGEGLKRHRPSSPLVDPQFLGALYCQGNVLLEGTGFLATHIFDRSYACQRYLKARYSHVLIDEYQDCGEWQHALFLRLAEIGLGAVAVGDIDQSIFAFAGKSSKFMAELAQDESRFVTYSLTQNHRCHTSIVNYATKLLSATFVPMQVENIQVYEKRIQGHETQTAQWLSNAVPQIAKVFGVEEYNKIAVLVKNNATRDLIDQNMKLPHKSFITTSLEEDSSLWGGVFRNALLWAYSTEITKHEFVEQYLNIDYQHNTVRKALKILKQIEESIVLGMSDVSTSVKLFVELASTLLPEAQNAKAVEQLTQILHNPVLRGAFVPARPNEVQLMTLHKAKGMEFEIVFHLNLLKWILPQYQGDRTQDLHLHYVGITRAKKCCVLCTSTQRTGKTGLVSAEDSEFLQINGLAALRVTCPC
jgi:superfamily I DNA/RNA helicase